MTWKGFVSVADLTYILRQLKAALYNYLDVIQNKTQTLQQLLKYYFSFRLEE